jgi:hypothetical protein
MFFWDIMADLSQLLHFAGVPRLAGATGTSPCFFLFTVVQVNFNKLNIWKGQKEKRNYFISRIPNVRPVL